MLAQLLRPEPLLRRRPGLALALALAELPELGVDARRLRRAAVVVQLDRDRLRQRGRVVARRHRSSGKIALLWKPAPPVSFATSFRDVSEDSEIATPSTIAKRPPSFATRPRQKTTPLGTLYSSE